MHFSSTRVMRRSVDEDNWFARTCSTYCKRTPLHQPARRPGSRKPLSPPCTPYWRRNEGKNFITTHADDLAKFIATLNAGPVHLIGWSHGGLVAATAAIRRSVAGPQPHRAFFGGIVSRPVKYGTSFEWAWNNLVLLELSFETGCADIAVGVKRTARMPSAGIVFPKPTMPFMPVSH